MAKKVSKKSAAKGARKAARRSTATAATAPSALIKKSKGKALIKKSASPKAARISVGEHATQRLIHLAATYFGSEPAAAAWFDYPKERLNGKSPRQACRTTTGREEVRSWLEEIADGAFS